MWVRNQDKDVIAETTLIKIMYYNNTEFKITGETSDSLIFLGIYSTKQQALQVLDEIQDRINEGCPFVYQMPEDDIYSQVVDEWIKKEEI